MKVVLDTNVWLDWLVFDDPRIARLRERVARGETQIVIDEACRGELARVLGYRFYGATLPREKQCACLEECARVAVRIDLREKEKKQLPRCADPDDQKFLELALAAQADCLVTRDLELLRLARRELPFRIVSPHEKF